MSSKTVKLLDPDRNVVATAQVSKRGERFTGQIDLTLMPEEMRRTFQEYEEIVNGQMFGLLDEIEEQIEAIGLRVVVEDVEASVDDLQVYPGTGRVSFRMVKQPVHE